MWMLRGGPVRRRAMIHRVTDSTELGTFLRHRRITAGLDREEAAEAGGMDHETIRHWEQGRHSKAITGFVKLIEAYGRE